jgi:hypothetical protein
MKKFSSFLINENTNRIIKDLKRADDDHELSNINHIISAMKKNKSLSKLAYMATELQKAAIKFEKTNNDDDYDDMQDMYYKLLSNIE